MGAQGSLLEIDCEMSSYSAHVPEQRLPRVMAPGITGLRPYQYLYLLL